MTQASLLEEIHRSAPTSFVREFSLYELVDRDSMGRNGVEIELNDGVQAMLE